MKRWAAIVALAGFLVAAGCSRAPGDPDGPGVRARVPDEGASIIGDITQVEQNGGRLRILVEQIPTRSAGEPIAWITITDRSHVLARADGRTSRATTRELAVGTRVWVWFTGPVLESFPVQATAGTVLVER